MAEHYCENQYCEHEAITRVPVSERRAGDSRRYLCTSCEEGYAIGVQHGTMTAQKQARRQLRDKDRTSVTLRKALRQVRKDIREAVSGVWTGSAEGWEYVITGINEALEASSPKKEKVQG